MGSGKLLSTLEEIIRVAEFLADFTADFTVDFSADIVVELWSKCDENDGGCYGKLAADFTTSFTTDCSTELNFLRR